MTLNDISRSMSEIAPHRSPALFNEFLVQGYTAITLDSVPSERFAEVLRSKLCLGTLITLYDDFADRPAQSDPRLLELLYRLGFDRRVNIVPLNPQHRRTVEFSQALFREMSDVLKSFPNFRKLSEIFDFDLEQFYTANRFSSLVSAYPQMRNTLENRLYTHHNMGMVLAAMMDLMASGRIVLSELGAMREVFLLGQRMGRIFNVLSTRGREVAEGDITGELAACRNAEECELAEQNLRLEIHELRTKIAALRKQITTFSVDAYLEGLAKVQRLHERMEGTI